MKRNLFLFIMRMQMRKILSLAAILNLTILAAWGQQKSWTADNGNGTFTNPLFYDEFSDPDMIRVNDTFYLVGTTMHCNPGLVVLESKDLVNWEFCSYAFDRIPVDDSRFRLEGGKEAYGQGIWAPCIRYHEGKFYIFSNINGIGMQILFPKIRKVHGNTTIWEGLPTMYPYCLTMGKYMRFTAMMRFIVLKSNQT